MQRNGSLIYVCSLCFSLLTIISTIVKYDRKNKKRNEARRNEDGLTPKQAKIQELKRNIADLKRENFTNTTIAKRLNIPLKTLERHITNMRKEGLL